MSQYVTRSQVSTRIANLVNFCGGLISEAVGDAESTDMAWKVDRNRIATKDLVLVSLAQVSKES